MSVMVNKRVLRVYFGLFLAAQPLTGLPDPEHHRITTSFSKAFFNPENSDYTITWHFRIFNPENSNSKDL